MFLYRSKNLILICSFYINNRFVFSTVLIITHLVIQCFILPCRCIPRKILIHSSTHQILPRCLIVCKHIFGIANNKQHLMSILIFKRKSCSRFFIFIGCIYRILNSSGLTDNWNGSIAHRHHLTEPTRFKQ